MAKLLLAEAPWRRANREAVAGRGAVAKLLLAGALMRMAGVFLAEMQQLTPKEWQRRSGREGVAVKEWQRRRAGGVLILIKNSVALGGVSWYLLDFLVNFVNWSDF